MTSGLLSNAVVRGILWMVLATGFQATASGFVRKLSFEFGVFELLFFFSAISAVLLMPMTIRLDKGAFAGVRRRWGLYLVRGLLSFAGMYASFYAYSVMDIANVQSLLFTVPLFTILLAGLLLGEYVGLRGWLSCVIGFAGAIIIVRPGIIPMNPGALAAIASALAFAAANIAIRKLGSTESPIMITMVSNGIVAVLSAIPAALNWVTPTWEQVPWILAMGILFMGAMVCLTFSIREADARIVQTINFLRLPWAVLVGWVMFTELPDIWTWVGAVIIFLGAYDVLRRETRGAKKE
ncbi:MAG: EamA family transporter [Alphaproteobacteria bacterium]|nr:EamA family transporter [Alphaproteobacteria bacterium]